MCIKGNVFIDYKYKYQNVCPEFPDIKFGIEIEFCTNKMNNGNDILNEFINNKINMSSAIVDSRKQNKNYQQWQLAVENSCSGWEIVTPIMSDTEKCWKELQEVCNILKHNLDSYINQRCSIHIHIDKKSVGLTEVPNSGIRLFNFIKIYRFLEPLTYCISSGEEKEVFIDRCKKYAMPFALAYNDKNEGWIRGYTPDETNTKIRNGCSDLFDSYFATRFVGVNFNTHNLEYATIEFRTFNGTLNPSTIQFYLTYAVAIIEGSINNQEDDIEHKNEFYKKDLCYFTFKDDYIQKCLHKLQANTLLKEYIKKKVKCYHISKELLDLLTETEIRET